MSQAIRGPVGEGGDEVSVARFIADQRTKHRVPHTLTCALLGVSLAWFYKWLGRASGPSAASGGCDSLKWPQLRGVVTA